MPSTINSKNIDELINNLKAGIGLWENLILKSSKFSNSIKSATASCSDLLDSMQAVCDLASKSNSGLRNTGISLTKLILRQKTMESKLTNVSKACSDNLVEELDKCVNEWRRSSASMKREREHDWKRANIEYQKSLAEVERTEKRWRKKNAGKVGLSETASLQIEYANQDAENKRRYVEELERSALRRAALEERQRFKKFLALLKPMLDCQLSIREDLDNLEEIIVKLYGDKAEDLDSLPEELEQNIQEHIIKSDSRTLIAKTSCTLAGQRNAASDGSRTSLHSNSISSTSSEWSHKNNAVIPNEVNSITAHSWDKTLTHGNSLRTNDNSESDESSIDGDNEPLTDHKNHDNEKQEYPDSLSLQPQRTMNTVPNTSQSQPNHISGNHWSILSPTQSIPASAYSNLSQLKIHSGNKFGVNTLSREISKERGQTNHLFADDKVPKTGECSTSFISGMERQNVISTNYSRSSVDLNEEVFHISPPPLFAKGTEELLSTFGDSKERGQDTRTRMLSQGDISVNYSTIRRASIATEMQLPQVPKTPNNIRRQSPQDMAQTNISSSTNRGRSMSVARVFNGELDDDDDTTSGDFNAIRQRIVSRINHELRPKILPKPNIQKKPSPSAHYKSFYNERVGKQNVHSPSMIESPHLRYQPFKTTESSKAGEEPSHHDLAVSYSTATRKENAFKQQLMSVLNPSQSHDASTINHIEYNQSTTAISSNPHSSLSSLCNLGTKYTLASSKGNNKSAMPNSKYIY